MMAVLAPQWSRHVRARIEVRRQLLAADFDGLEQSLRGLFAAIPHDWHRRNEIARYEGYYASVMYSYHRGARAGRNRRGQRQLWTPGHGSPS